MEWEFLIPLKKEDLTKATLEGQYYVKDVFAPSECSTKLKECKKDILTNGCEAILVHFDTLYSFLLNSSEVTLYELQDIYDSIINSLLTNLTETVQTTTRHDDPSCRLQSVNIIKMIIYVYSMHLRAYEEKLSVVFDNLIGESKKGRGQKGKPKPQKAVEQWDWNDRKRQSFINIFQILQEKLNSFWVSNIVEEPFINLIGNCCYKVYENPEINQAKQKPLRDTVAQVLAVLVTSYNHILTFIPRAIQLMKQYEHSVSPISGAVLIMINDFNCSSLLQKVMRDLKEALTEEGCPTLAKASSVFINDIADVDAMLFIPSLKYLCPCLDHEAYTIRNAVLTVFAEIVIKCHNNEINDQLKKMRNQLLKVLHRHLLDVSSYVRSKVLQLWTKLAIAHAIPKNNLSQVLHSAKESINDKSSLVCRNAILLFKTVLKDNPFGGKFVLSELRKTLTEEKALLKTLESSRTLTRDESWSAMEGQLVFALTKAVGEDCQDYEELPATQSVVVMDVVVIISSLLQQGHFADAYKLLKQSELQFPNAKEIRCNATYDDKVDYYLAALKKIYMTCSCPEVCAAGNSGQDYETQKAVVDFMEESIAFALLIHNAIQDIQGILRSKTPTEAQEAIEFFSVAYQFGVDGTPKVIRDMLFLVWSKQQGIKESVAAAYKTLYLISMQPTPQLAAMQVANRLVKLVLELNMEQKVALEILISEWMKSGDLTKDFINALGIKYSKTSLEGNVNESIAAAVILIMVARCNTAVVSSNIPLLIEHGLNEKANFKMVQYTCDLLSKMKNVKVNGLPTRYPADHEIFQKATNILINNFGDLDTIGYKNMAYSVINLIFDVAVNPEVVVDNLLSHLYPQIYPPDVLNTTEGGEQEALSQKDHLWEKLFDVYGEIVFRKWQFFDKFVFSSLKKSEGTIDKNQMENLDEFEADNVLAADEDLCNRITEYCERMVYGDHSFEGFMKKKIIKVCKGHGEKGSPSFKISAIVAFSKLMVVSQKFCEDHIQLYVTVMEKSVEEGIRSSLVLGFGDLLCRFPNVIEPWTNYLYSKLSEKSTVVRENTVNVLCHLISREMVKVRGSIARLCLCLEDPDPSIAEQVHNILFDLANKGNSLYNVVPDIISRLSSPDSEIRIDKAKFERVVGVILDLVVKERQSDLLVEALCRRLKETTDEEQAEDLAFCLAHMNYSEKSLRRLSDFLPSLTEKLLIPEVYDKITAILNNSSKTTFKPQLKEIALEGLAKIEELLSIKDPCASSRLSVNTVNDTLVTPTPKRTVRGAYRRTPGSTSKTGRKSKTPARPKKSRTKMIDSSDECDSSEELKETVRSKRTKRACAQPIIEESSPECSSSD